MNSIRGLYTVLITPFDHHGHLDEEGLRQNIRFQLEHKIDGIVALGTTGECPTLSADEQIRVIKIAHEEIKGRIPLMIGTGSYSTEETLRRTRLAEEMGADSALIVTPYYNKPTQEGLYQHFKTVAQGVSIPICVYNVQGRTGQNIQTETLKRLADIPNIISVKEASGNISQICDVIELVAHYRPGFTVMSGDDALTLPLMALGGHGILSVVSNLVPQQMVELVKALNESDYELAREWHYRLLPFFKAAFIETNPMPIKAAMRLAGMPAGRCRLPLCDLQPENEKKLQIVMQALQLKVPTW